MVLILDVHTEHIAQASMKIGFFEEKNRMFDFSRSINHMPLPDQITEIRLYVRTYF